MIEFWTLVPAGSPLFPVYMLAGRFSAVPWSTFWVRRWEHVSLTLLCSCPTDTQPSAERRAEKSHSTACAYPAETCFLHLHHHRMTTTWYLPAIDYPLSRNMSPAPSASPGRGTAPRRRNGRQQACEPCRKRKVACDHQMPVCSRCKSGENPSSCVYTKQVVSKGRSTRTSSTATLRRTGQPRRPTSDSTPLTPPTHKEGYLGVTSYKYAMCEAQLKMAPVPPPEDPPRQGNALELELSQSRIMCDDKTYEAAMRVLQAIPEKSLAYDLLKAHGNPNDGWCKLATLRLHDSLWNTFGSYLDSDRSPESLFQLAMKLYDNSFKPLHEDYTDPKEWLASFSGYNMRWEAIGILFTQWSFGAIAYHQGRPESSSHLSSDYAGYVLKYKNCAWDLVDMTRNTASANTLLLYLMYRQEGLESIITGDDSKFMPTSHPK